jgi:dynein heavy chain
VKLCSVGYTEFELMSQKFFVLYNTCKQQLSAQRHYDWGLRNILSVLRTAGETKRKNLDKPEAFLLYRTLRDMNLSKLVAQDVPLFLSVLADLFPGTAPPPKGTYPEIEAELRKKVEGSGLIYHLDWTAKVIQLYETTRVRHGIMLVGPTGGGKSKIILNLRQTLEETDKVQYREQRFNPKAIRAPEMYGEVDAASGEWTTGVFAAIWAKCNNRNNAYTTWIVADGPVDAIWIEDLNTVLDDNKLLTLANGDRIPMTENVKIMFEVETLVNASPATVSGAGIIYVSDTDLDWTPTVKSWVSRERPDALQAVLTEIIDNYLGESTPVSPGVCFDFINRNLKPCMAVSRVGATTGLCNLLEVLMQEYNANDPIVLEKLFVYALCWSIGGLLEPDDRVKFDAWLREIDRNGCMPVCKEHETIYEYYVSPDTSDWVLWRPPKWEYPSGDQLDFSNLLVPTMDSTRSLFLLSKLQSTRVSTLMLGGAGTAKTSTALMFFDTLDPHVILKKRVNFSSATTPRMAQDAVDEGLDKRQGKTYGPPNNKRMTIFMDDVSMPEVNNWGDQPTLELIRLLVEQGGFMFLDRDKRGEKKTCDDLQYIAAMQHPGGGKNDIPNRLKRNFFIFNLVLPSIISINDIYGQMLGGRFPPEEFTADAKSVLKSLTKATIELWRTCKDKLLPTPAKFHYIFNMRELSRVFQGVLSCGTDILLTGGSYGSALGIGSASIIVGLWKHECDRVFCDKLTNYKDKEWFAKTMEKLLADQFDEAATADLPDKFFMVNFLREDVKDEETDEIIEKAPKVYEPGGSLETLRPIVLGFLDRYNETFPAKQMSLVLFDDALAHLLRLNRLVEMPRGSALLVGVGGSGKQSLTKLAAFVSRAELFQITLTKTYNMASLMEDLRFLFQSAGHQRKQTVFLFTESEIKQEVFLEVINSVLMTGEVPGLFAKDERLGMTSDLQPFFVKERPGMEESQDNLWQYFTDLVRDNLHLVLCMSPLNPMFPVRARKFPGLISGPTVDWFLSWPADALVAVSRGFIKDFPVECDAECKVGLMDHMGAVHSIVVEVCDEYFAQYRRAVSQTPKSYLSFIASYKDMYRKKLAEIKDKEKRVNLGLEKLIKGAEDVEQMKILLAEEDIKLAKATEETNVMLVELQKNAAEAQTESAKVLEIKTKCESDAIRIAAEKSDCEQDLARCQPIVDAALKAVDSIKPADINEVKKLPNPADIIKLIFDVVLILFKYPLGTVHAHELSFSSGKIIKPFLEPSFKPQAQALLNDSAFLNYVKEFSSTGKDVINEETIELMQPYLQLEEYNAKIAKGASNAAEGLCVWSRAMNDYHEASKIVKPKLEALAIAQAQMDAANAALAAAEKRLAACQALLDDLQSKFDAQMAEKKKIEDGAAMLQRKSTQATQLIEGLSGERIRWTEDSKTFESIKMRLVGDCAVSCAFVSYCGPFNQDFRSYLCDKFTKDCISKEVPVTKKLDVTDFLVDIGTIGDWNMEGLPTDPLSIQNGILVTRSSRYPMLIDPQGQALGWIRRREAERMPHWGTVLINDAKLKDKLEFAMGNDAAFVVVGVENTVDPMLDPLLEKEIVVKGRRKMITISDKQMDFTDGFMLYFITRLPNPSFSPELQAKTTIVDFTVTQKGLEEQLLGIVISKEQKALEEQLSEVLEEVNSSTKMLLDLDKSLLDRLTSNTGNLLDDEELVGVLNNTKQKAADVKIKLTAAADTKKSINEKREQFRPVATRGSVLYFAIVEMSLVNPMYQTALAQFLGLFNASMNRAEKASLASKRVGNIIETMTRIVYRYINRGLYEADKLAFLLIVTLKILITAGLLKTSDISLLLRGGASLDMSTAKRKPFNWLSNEAWLNVCALSQGRSFFANLKEEMSANEVGWRNWFEDNEPEARAIPDYESKLAETADIGPFFKLLLVRSLRMDRAILTAKEFIRETPVMGQYYVDPVTDTTEMLYEEMVADTPVIFLLSRGADPTESIEALAKKRKFPPPAVISLGEGQDVIAKKQLEVAAKEGTWVLLQNCELMLELMDEMEQIIAKFKETYLDSNFRLFITALPHPEFPLGLLQMSTKVTNEPPAGLKAGVLRSYTVLVDQDRLERVDGPRGKMWRQLLFALCFLHSTVQERRKFGSIGWCIPYEYSTGDITACIVFLERHLYSGEISWDTFQYMVADVQYGGKITDDLDRRLFQTYAKSWLNLSTCEEGHSFSPAQPILRLPSDFQYTVPSGMEIKEYKDYISGFPEIDSPEIFGLHPNADLTFRNNEVSALIRTLGETQPKGSGGGGGVSREEVVLNKASELLERLPEDFIEDDYKAKLNKLGGLDKPLNIFLFQEIQRLQKVIGKVRFILEQLQLAINGEVVMTDELQQTLDAMFEAKVPHLWTYAVSGDEFSWILPTLGLWFTALLSRDGQNRKWLEGGRPDSFWLTGFFNPNGFLTAMKQEVVRKHKAEKWSLDDVVDRTEVTTFETPAKIKEPINEGVYVHGLFIEGAGFDRAAGLIIESEPKKLYVPMPVLFVSANAKKNQDALRKEQFGSLGPFDCPVYKYPKRTDRFYIFIVTLKCPDSSKGPAHWVLRAAALLCNSET